MPTIDVNRLSKRYPVAMKEAGLGGTLKHFFRRQYRLVEAVKDISFHIEPGEVVGFLGPNGAGKTTTLKMLTGLIHPSSGTVRVGDFTPPFSGGRIFCRILLWLWGKNSSSCGIYQP